jgi:competence protein ComEC
LLSVPLMGVLVMPAAVLAVCLAPFGLWGVGLWFMEKGLQWILFVAETVAERDGALSHVVAPDWFVLPILTLGLLWIILIAGRGRIIGVAGVLLAAVLWQQTARPDLLVADSGALIGLNGAQGRVLSKPTGNGFVAGIWLENDGAPGAQAIAAERVGLAREGRVVTAALGPWRVTQVSGKTALADLSGCDGADVLISNQTDEVARPCVVFDIKKLRVTGALAFNLSAQGDLIVTTAHEIAGLRPWNMRQGPMEPSLTLAYAPRKRAADATLFSENTTDQ